MMQWQSIFINGVVMAHLKKKLQQFADESMKSAHDEGFKQKASAMLENANDIKVHSNKKRIWALSSVAILLVAICMISVFVLSFYNTNNNEKGYSVDFEKVEKSSLEELNNNIVYLQFNSLDNVEVQRKYDDVSKDTLMFIYNFDNLDAFNSINMHILTNPNYVDTAYADKIFDRSVDYRGYRLKYTETVEEADGIYEFQVEGKLLINNLTICFRYQNISFTEESGLNQMLDMLIRFD